MPARLSISPTFQTLIHFCFRMHMQYMYASVALQYVSMAVNNVMRVIQMT